MKISSKSILSPGRAGSARDPPSSLSTSLSRRLRNSRSIKGGASPAMFPATGKRRGSGFDNPEPSSPKVTCIGQVRVKTKKKHVKRTLSRRHSAGEVSFRKLQHSGDGFSGQNQHPNQEYLPEQRNNQRWVHLPLTICEALREFSCMFPCRSSCSSTPATEKEEKTAAGSVDGNRQGSCSAVFARWLVAMQDSDGGERVAGAVAVSGAGDDDDDDDDEDEDEVRNSRRHVFQDLEIVNDCIQGSKDEARVSICVPPKNALLLMRCRSDPMKMEALTNRFWEPSVGKNEEGDEEIVKEEDEIEEKRDIVAQEDLQFQKEEKVMDLDEIHEVNDQEHRDLQEDAIDQEKVETNLETEMKQSIQEEEDQEHSIESNEKEDQEQSIETNAEEEEEDQEQSMETNEEEEEGMFLGFLFEENADEDQEFQENDESDSDMEDAKEELFEEEDEDVQEIKAEESTSNTENEEEMATEFTEKSETPEETHEEEVVMESKKAENEVLERESEVKEERESITSVLPECLLLMMCEPKLSMEVSKETWVCSTDFIRQPSGRKKPPPPPPPVKSVNGQSESNTAVAQYQPSRSSCSLPAPQSMTAMLEQKLVNSLGFEPFVLTRCKSEPMRTAAAKLVPESCFWKNRKLEPLGIGLAGLGF